MALILYRSYVWVKRILHASVFIAFISTKWTVATQEGYNSDLTTVDSDFQHWKECSSDIQMSLCIIARNWSGLTKAHNDTDVRKRQSYSTRFCVTMPHAVPKPSEWCPPYLIPAGLSQRYQLLTGYAATSYCMPLTESLLWLVFQSTLAASTTQPVWILSVSSRPRCLSSHTYNDFSHFVLFCFITTPCKRETMFKPWRHGAMVGWGNSWFNCHVIYLQKVTVSVCIKANHPLMMARIYTNTQTCTDTVHTVYLYTYCIHAHICMCLNNI